VRLKRFHRLLDVHGPELGRWPAAEQAAARRLLADDPAARAAQDGARRLDDWLGQVPGPVGGGSANRVASVLRRLPQQQPPARWSVPIMLWDLLPPWPRGLALATMAALGIVVGLTDIGGTPAPASSADVSGLIFDPNPAVGLGQ
jgi:hypothetical protein